MELIVKAADYALTRFEKRVLGLAAMAKEFLAYQAFAGIMLVIAATIAIILANTPFYDLYDYIFNDIKFHIGFDDLAGNLNFNIKKSNLLWINDGLMAIFFFLVGLEIKREIKDGELSKRARALLPALGAVGGMVVPALIYYVINMNSPETMGGWAIPAATDIAFALGVIMLLGDRVPIRLKILLTAIAVIDDLGAIIIIAIFYTHGFNPYPLYFAGGVLALLAYMNARNVSHVSPYIILGIILWIAVLKSGIHATLAGVVTAFFIPFKSKENPDYSPCVTLEHGLHPWVAYAILPLFAFANAGVPFQGMGIESLSDPVTLGIIAGLVIGKPLGIFTMLFLAIKTGLSPKPQGASWMQLFGVSIMCGIGFTMSLFIGSLAFDGIELQASIRLGVLVASVIAAVTGFMILRLSPDQSSEQ